MESICQDIYKMLCKKYPNRKIYVIGDHHFFHDNIILYTRKEFSNVLEMNQFIIQKHNEVVGKEDIVIFLGDLCFKNGMIKTILEQMNGHKYLILGNHDAEKIERQYPVSGFEGVYQMPIKIEDKYLSHEPLKQDTKNELHLQLVLQEFEKKETAMNYHGHIHSAKTVSKKHQNATCEALEYKPLLIGTTTNSIAEKEWFINSSYFDQALTMIKETHHINPKLVLSDYIYSVLLESSSLASKQYFIQGSFGLFKKYGFISNFSDLDLSFITQPQMSKRKNLEIFKTIVDQSYHYANQIDHITLKYHKRYPSLRIFEATYTSLNSFVQCFLDANYICFDCYKDTDFLRLEKISLMEKSLKKESSLLQEYQFPHFESQFLKPECDIVNLGLQILFQQKNPEKKELALKKIRYVYERCFKKKTIENFLDIWIRFYLKNIFLLSTRNRYGEIEYIQTKKQIEREILSSMPTDLSLQLLDLFNHPIFKEIVSEISSIKVRDTSEKYLELVKKYNLS